MAHDNAIQMDDNRLYIVWLFREIGTLSNVLYAVAQYKKVMGTVWPSTLVRHVDNRMTFGMGEDTDVVRRKDGVLVGALYLSTFAPKMDTSNGERTPTILEAPRKPLGRVFRDRRLVDDERTSERIHRGPVKGND
jgi:hypothetical protein